MNTWVKFTSLGLQMGLTIYVFSLLGSFLDDRYPQTGFSWFKALTLFAVFGSTYSIIRQVIKMSNNE